MMRIGSEGVVEKMRCKKLQSAVAEFNLSLMIVPEYKASRVDLSRTLTVFNIGIQRRYRCDYR